MRTAKMTVFLLTGFLSYCGVAAAQQADPSKDCTSQLDGAWKEVDGEGRVLFRGDQIVIGNRDGSLRIARIISQTPCHLVVRDQGLRGSWDFNLKDGVLRINGPGVPQALRLLPVIPTDLDTSASLLPGVPPPIAPERAKAAGDELLKRARADQAALKNPDLKGARPQVIADNVRFLRALVREVGWIDIPRFGKDASAAATLIAKHASDLLLMRSALPTLEEDVKLHGGSGEMFAVLYDELAIVTGNKQRYGTQVVEDSSGRPFVLPVDDPARVDALRHEIGILSWQQYLALLSETLYDGAPIRVAGDDE